MLRPGANDDVWAESGVKGDKTALVPHGQPEQVTVGDLAMAEQALPVELTAIEQAVVVNYESVFWVCQGLRKALCHRLQRRSLWVRGLRHDAQAHVLCQGARDPAVFNFLL